ncbi:universal stress protein [Aquimarina sp. MMG016]|uniref:universal stress protein n=1 Tax=Aquimarina sp. MMG016 TaxID=2822690 RepID=UPI001B3A4869|nr:universal stress protein [Aquimarina sp. MMG016]MBQ4820948.1 universal stress protein [Aquimarina sp. MMG016]
MKKILIPTDFSDNAWNTILYAMELYANIPCDFYILNTYDITPVKLVTTVSSQRVGHLYETVKIESEQGLKMILDDISNSNTSLDHSFKTISKSGSLSKVLRKMTKKDHYDSIVIGTKGATGAKEIFLGSNTHRVIKEMPNCPVLIIPEESYFEEISNVAFATDFARIYHRAEIQPIVNLAKSQDATVRMIHVYDEPKLNIVQHYNSNSLEEYFKKLKYDFHVIPDFSTVEKAIQAFIEELEIDVLAMINYPHSFIERLFREKVIKKITFHTTIPFLVIPADN